MQKKFWNFKKFEPPSMAPPLKYIGKKQRCLCMGQKWQKIY